LRVKAQGKAVVTLAYEENTVMQAQITVRVYGTYKAEDGSELIMLRTEDATYEAYDGTVNGRTGVYKYTDASAGSWQDRLAVYESAHPVGITNASIPFVNSEKAFENMVTKNYNYVAIDVCLTAGAFLRVESMSSVTNETAKRKDYRVGYSWQDTINAVADTNRQPNNDCIQLYYRGVEVKSAEKIVADRWYTVIIDRKSAQAPKDGNVWSAINFAGSTGTIYFDDVRYYFDDTCYSEYAYAQKDGYVEYDGSELVWGARTSSLTATTPYGLTEETVGERTGVYKVDFKGSGGWTDKLMVYESGHILYGIDKGNLQTTFPFNESTAVDDAFRNLTNKGYNYVTIDVCFTSSSLLRCGAPQSGGIADKRDDISFGKYSKDDNDCIALYKNGVLVQLNDTIETGVWYTLVFDHASAIANRTAGQWSAMNFSGQGVTYFDKVRYYSAKPFVISG